MRGAHRIPVSGTYRVQYGGRNLLASPAPETVGAELWSLGRSKLGRLLAKENSNSQFPSYALGGDQCRLMDTPC